VARTILLFHTPEPGSCENCAWQEPPGTENDNTVVRACHKLSIGQTAQAVRLPEAWYAQGGDSRHRTRLPAIERQHASGQLGARMRSATL
jgi:hypothetical protein